MPRARDRPGSVPGLAWGFGWSPPPESNRRHHPYHRWSARSGDKAAPRSALQNYKWLALSTIEKWGAARRYAAWLLANHWHACRSSWAWQGQVEQGPASPMTRGSWIRRGTRRPERGQQQPQAVPAARRSWSIRSALARRSAVPALPAGHGRSAQQAGRPAPSGPGHGAGGRSRSSRHGGASALGCEPRVLGIQLHRRIPVRRAALPAPAAGAQDEHRDHLHVL
jgi:hypothetical protein